MCSSDLFPSHDTRALGLVVQGMIQWVSGNWSVATSIEGDVSGATANISGFVSPSYSIGDKVIWGGYSWTNVNGLVGSSTDVLNLDAEWTKNVYDTTNYNIAYDLIEYDYANDMIIRRYEKESNVDVKCSKAQYDWFFDNWGFTYHSISVQQFGNAYNITTYKGQLNIDVNNGYNESINFSGAYQSSLTFGSSANQSSLTFGIYAYQNSLTFGSNASQVNLTFGSGAYQDNLIFGSSANYTNDMIIRRFEKESNVDVKCSKAQYDFFGDNNGFTYHAISVQQFGNEFKISTYKGQLNIIVENGYNESVNFSGASQENLTFSSGASQSNLTFGSGASQENLTFGSGAYQNSLTFGSGASQQNLTFGSSAGQNNLTFGSSASQSNLTFGSNVRQEHLTFTENTQLDFNNQTLNANIEYVNFRTIS